MPGTNPQIHAVDSSTEDETTMVIIRPTWTHIFMLINSLMLIIVIACGVFLVSAVSDLSETTRQQATLIDQTKNELSNLRHVIGNQTAEDIVFLKTIILKPNIDPALARTIAGAVRKNSIVFKRDPDFILAMIEVESNFNPDAISSVGAVGLMQVMPHWKEQLAIDGDLKDPTVNIHSGLRIYAFYESMYSDTETSLQAYNRGPGIVDWDLIKGRDPARNGYADKILKVYERLRSMTIGR